MEILQSELKSKTNYQHASLAKLKDYKAFRILAPLITNVAINLILCELDLEKKWVKEVNFGIFQDIALIGDHCILDCELLLQYRLLY